jgi:hypothetical protein
LLFFVHTSWCKYCKMMENITFKTQKLLAYWINISISFY